MTFDGSGSTDADGPIVAWTWNFGDGTSATGAVVEHDYVNPGSYTVVLTVTDDTGLTDTASTAITVQAVAPLVRVGSLSVRVVTPRPNQYQCVATATVLDDSGRTVPSTTVSGLWSGVVTGNASGVTGSTGTATVNSAKTKKRGTCTFEVQNLQASGYAYQAPSSPVRASVSF